MKQTAKRILAAATATALAAFLCVPVFAAEFSDVSAGHWAYKAISACERRGIVSGYSDGTFHPEKTVTNVQFVAMVTRAFYPEEVSQYASSEAAAYEPWWWPNWRVMLDAKLSVLTGLNGVSAFQESANDSITRYNMAQMVYNVLKDKGFSVSEAERAAVKKAVGDWTKIPVKYRDAVASVYALGVIGGQSDGRFGGENFMNRAQGCTVIERAYELISMGPSASVAQQSPSEPVTSKPETAAAPSTPSEPEMPITPPVTSKPETVVTIPPAPSKPETSVISPATPKPEASAAPPTAVNPERPVAPPEISKPQTPAAPEPPPVINQEPELPPYVPEEKTAPTLANGAEITEENVLEILAELKEAYPDGMEWGGSTRRPGTPSEALNNTIKRSYNHHLGGYVSMERACGGFASLISDSIFGSGDANPARKLDSLADIRPGDVLIKLDGNGRLTHVSIAAARPSETIIFYGVTAYRVDARSGNINEGVVYSHKSTLPSEAANGFYCEAWTRYPE